MKTINLFLTDMNVAGNTSGVDRYLSVLIDGLKHYPHVNVCRINFRHDPEQLLCTESVKDNYKEVVIPMPVSPDEMISKEFWTDRYNAVAYHITQHLFEGKENILFHLHTLNLMDFALTVKKHHPVAGLSPIFIAFHGKVGTTAASAVSTNCTGRFMWTRKCREQKNWFQTIANCARIGKLTASFA